MDLYKELGVQHHSHELEKIDGKLPNPGVLVPMNRAERRRMVQGRYRCSRCRGALLAGQVLCYDDGHSAHLDCSEERNRVLAECAEEMAAQEEEEDRRAEREARIRSAEAHGLTVVGGRS